MSDSQTIVLITGANSGIGFELASQLMAKGSYHILVCARTPSKGEAAITALRALNHPGSCELLHLDQTSDESIAKAAQSVRDHYGRLDVLVNNAAIAFTGPVTRAELLSITDTNVAGPALVSEAFLPLLKQSKGTPRIVHVSSGAGSMALKLDHGSRFSQLRANMYRMSKAALNMLAACQVWDYKEDGVKVLVYCPGFTESNLGEMNKVANGARAVAVSTGPLTDIVVGKRDGDVGKFLSYDGEGGVWAW